MIANPKPMRTSSAWEQSEHATYMKYDTQCHHLSTPMKS